MGAARVATGVAWPSLRAALESCEDPTMGWFGGGKKGRTPSSETDWTWTDYSADHPLRMSYRMSFRTMRLTSRAVMMDGPEIDEELTYDVRRTEQGAWQQRPTPESYAAEIRDLESCIARKAIGHEMYIEPLARMRRANEWRPIDRDLARRLEAATDH